MKWSKYIRIWLFSVLSLLLIACSQKEDLVIPEDSYVAAETDAVYSGVMKVKFSQEVAERLNVATRSGGIETTGETEVDRLIAGLGEVRISRVFPPAGEFEPRQRRAGLDRWFRIEYDNGIDPLVAVRQYSHIRGVEKACPEYRYALEPYQLQRAEPGYLTAGLQPMAAGLPFNDPGLKYQWHYESESFGYAPEVGLGLFQAWKATAGSQEVVVAVIDMGVETSHEDLKANMWMNAAEVGGKSGVDDDGNGYSDDICGYNFFNNRGELVPADHATHIAGTIAAENNNNKGVCGIAGGDGIEPGVRIMACQIADPLGLSLKGMEAAFAYAANNGAVIAQCSWNVKAFDQALYDAIQYFVDYAGCDKDGNQTGPMKGGIAFFGAGNDAAMGSPKRYPAGYDNTIAVAALDEKNMRPSYSNYGSWIDISAPGGTKSLGVYSTLTNNGYGYMNGTSMACPHVSGVAALVVSVKGKPGFTNKDLKDVLFESVVALTDEPRADQMGRGGLRADRAVWRDDHTSPDQVTDLRVSQESDLTFRLAWTIAADPNDGAPKTYSVYSGSEPGNGEAWERKEVVRVTGKVGEQMTWTIGAKETLSFAVAGTDLWGNTSELSNVVTRVWEDDGEAPEQVSGLQIREEEKGIVLSWPQVSDRNDGTAALYVVKAWRNGAEEKSWNVTAAGKKAGEVISTMAKELTGEPKEYIFTVTAMDRWGNVSLASEGVGLSAVETGQVKAGEIKAVALENQLHLWWGSDFSGAKQLRMYDLSGRRLFTRILSGNEAPGYEEVILPGLSAGLYTVELETADHKIRKQVLLQ